MSCKEESLPLNDVEVDHLADLASKVLGAAGEVILRHHLARGNVFKVNGSSWTSMAAEAEKAMIALILKDLPDHAVYGKQSGWINCGESTTPEFVWVLDPINGAEERLVPTFGTSIGLVYNGRPIIGCICNVVTGIKTIGMKGKKTTRNRDIVKTRACEHLEQAYVDIKDPGYNEDAKYAYDRLAYKIGETFFNGKCVAYSELVAGMLQVVVDCAVEPYGLLGVIPIVEGAGGVITDWQGKQISWQPSPTSSLPRDGFKIERKQISGPKLRNQWMQQPSLCEKKGSLAGASLCDKMFAIGGGNGVQCFSEVEMLDLNIGKWIFAPSLMQKRFAPAATDINGAVYAVGGCDGETYLKKEVLPRAAQPVYS